jgi:hypothetical protein
MWPSTYFRTSKLSGVNYERNSENKSETYEGFNQTEVLL